MSGLRTIDEARTLVLARTQALAAEQVPIAEAGGRVLARDASIGTDLPPFRSSAMDGYAVHAADTPGVLRLVGQSAAGKPFTGSVGPGEAIEISTGAVVPDHLDAVVPVERTQPQGEAVSVEGVEPGAHVRPRGGDARAGDLAVSAGTRLGPAQIGALAAGGVGTLEVVRRPRVGVLATGTELRPPGSVLEPGQIFESNTLMLAALAASAGAETELLAAVADDEAATREAIERGLGFDLLLTSGGVSVGPHDLVRGALAELGAEEVFWRVAVKPGRPIAFAVRERTLVFGLPGNPVSSLVGFELFVRPALEALQGARDPGPHYEPGVLASALARGEGRDELVRARRELRDESVVLAPLTGQESHMIARAAAADALVLVERGSGELPAGATVRYLRI